MENDILVCACHNVDHNVIVTHDNDFAERSDRTITMQDGRIIKS